MKLRLRTTVVPGLEGAPATRLRRVARVNRLYPDTACFRLVGEIVLEDGKRPGMQPALTSVGYACPHPRAYVGQIFHHQCGTGLKSIHNTATYYMIMVPTPPGRFTGESAQVPFGACGPFLLQSTAKSEGSSIQFPPAPFTVEAIIRGNGVPGNPQVTAHHHVGFLHFWGRKSHADMQIPTPPLVDQIRRSRWMACIGHVIGWHPEGDGLPPTRGGKSHRCTDPIQLVGVQVVARGAGNGLWATRLPVLLEESKRAFDRFSGLDAGLNMEVAHQSRRGPFAFLVGQMVQFDAVPLGCLPTGQTHQIERRGELMRCFRQHFGLLRRRVKAEAYRSIHPSIIPYAVSFR